MARHNIPVNTVEPDQKLVPQHWLIMQDVVHAAETLCAAFNRAEKARLLSTPVTAEQRDMREEDKVVYHSSGQTYTRLRTILSRRTAHDGPAVLGDRPVPVASAEIKYRQEVREALRAHVDKIYRQAAQYGLMRPDPQNPQDELRYAGPRLAVPLRGAFNALRGWDMYDAAPAMIACIANAARKPLALPAPGMSSQRSSPSRN